MRPLWETKLKKTNKQSQHSTPCSDCGHQEAGSQSGTSLFPRLILTYLRCFVFQMWTSVWASSTTAAAGQLVSTRAEAFSVSAQSVPVPMATSATSRHFPCKWIQPNVTRLCRLSCQCKVAVKNKPDSHLKRLSRRDNNWLLTDYFDL